MSELLFIGHDNPEDLPQVIQEKQPLYQGLVQELLNQGPLGDRWRIVSQLSCRQGDDLHYWRTPLMNYTLEGQDDRAKFDDAVSRAQVGHRIILNWVREHHPSLEILPGLVHLEVDSFKIDCWPRFLVYDKETHSYSWAR